MPGGGDTGPASRGRVVPAGALGPGSRSNSRLGREAHREPGVPRPGRSSAVSVEQGASAVSGQEPENVAKLRAAFESVEGDARERVDAERIFDALHGELDPEDRRAVVDELVSNPGAAEAWRLAREMDPGPGAQRSGLVQNWRWLAAAAAVVLTVGIGWQLMGPARDTTEPVYRGVESRSITSALAPDAALPRAQPVLRWNGVPGARYRVRVLTPDLEVLETSAESDAAEYRLSDETMRRVNAGSYILWQVEGRIPG